MPTACVSVLVIGVVVPVGTQDEHMLPCSGQHSEATAACVDAPIGVATLSAATEPARPPPSSGFNCVSRGASWDRRTRVRTTQPYTDRSR